MSALSQEHFLSTSHVLLSFVRCCVVLRGNAVMGHHKGAGGFAGGQISNHGECEDKSPGHRDALVGCRQQGWGQLQMTKRAAKLSADSQPAASSPYKEQLWEARDIPGNSTTIRENSSGEKISDTG